MKKLKNNLQGLDHTRLWSIAELIVNSQLDQSRVQDIEKEEFDCMVDELFDELLALQD